MTPCRGFARLARGLIGGPLIFILTLVVVLAGGVVRAPAAHADAIDDMFALLTTDKYNDTEKAVPEIAASGLSTAATLLDALENNELYFDTDTLHVYYEDDAGKIYDVRTGKPADGITGDNFQGVRIDNAVRSVLEASRGMLALVSPEPHQRSAAAAAVFATHDASALKAVQAALAKETDPGVKKALAEAQAAIVVSDAQSSDSAKLAAIDVLRAREDQDSLGLLAELSAVSNGAVKTAALAAISAVQFHLNVLSNIQNVFYGLSLGSVLLLAAIGLAITFGVMGVINMAHGEMVMLGAYTTFVVQSWIKAHDPALNDASLIIALPLAFLVTGIIGIAIERSIIRFLYGRPLETLLATFGLSLVLQQAVRTIFGADNQLVAAPPFMSGSFNLAGLTITSGRMWIIIFALVVFALIQLVLRATPFGLRMRAVTQNRRMASAIGINTRRIDALAFGLGSGIAGIAGVALSQIDNVSPNLGQNYIIDSFMVVVFGGVGNLWGTLVAGLTLGVANKFMEPIVGAVLAKILVLVFIILFIQKRPRGLFALKGRAVEA